MVKTLFAIALLGTFAYAQETELSGNDDIFVISQKPDTIDEAMEKKRSHSFECTTVSTSAVNGLTSSELLEKYQEAMREYNDEHLHDKVMSSLTNQTKKSMKKFDQYKEHKLGKRSGDKDEERSRGSRDSDSDDMRSGKRERDMDKDRMDRSKDDMSNGPRDGKSTRNNRGRNLQRTKNSKDSMRDAAKREGNRTKDRTANMSTSDMDRMRERAERESRDAMDRTTERAEREGRDSMDRTTERAEREGRDSMDRTIQRADREHEGHSRSENHTRDHSTEMEESTRDHQRVRMERMRQRLEKEGYSPDEIERLARMIQSTEHEEGDSHSRIEHMHDQLMEAGFTHDQIQRLNGIMEEEMNSSRTRDNDKRDRGDHEGSNDMRHRREDMEDAMEDMDIDWNRMDKDDDWMLDSEDTDREHKERTSNDKYMQRKDKVIREFNERRQKGKNNYKKQFNKLVENAYNNEAQDIRQKQRRRVAKVAACNPEGPNGWKTYQMLSEVTLFHEPCNDNDDNECFSGAVFDWLCPTSGDSFKCSVGFVKENEDESNFNTVSFDESENVQQIQYAIAENGQFSWFQVATETYNVEVGTESANSQTIEYDQTVIGLYVDATEGYITDFGAFLQDSETCDCENQTEIVKSNFHESMMAVRRDARQKVNAITNVGPHNTWNYCGRPDFELTDETPEWFTIDGNKMKVTKSEDVEGIFTLNGIMSIGSYSEEGQINAYINTLVDCEELTDGSAAAREFLAWVSEEKDIYSPEDLGRHAQKKMMKMAEYWWRDSSGYLSKPKAIEQECPEFFDDWMAVIDDWVSMVPEPMPVEDESN